MGQLGLGEDVMEKARPALVDLPDKVVQVCGGGMHTVCLTEKGEVSLFLMFSISVKGKLSWYYI